MIEKFLESLDPKASKFVLDTIKDVSIKDMSYRRDSKNPDGSYNSEGISISINYVPNMKELLDTGDLTMCMAFIQEANYLISFLTTGVMHAEEYKIRKHNLVERFDRLCSIKLGYERENKPFKKKETIKVD